MINLFEILKKTNNFGTWKTSRSSNDSDIPVTNSKKYFPKYDNRNIYWIESCSANNNQESIMILNSQNEIKNLTGKKYNVRSKVHEYGGVAYAVDNDRVFFINHTDQNIYLIEDEKIHQITKHSNLRIGDIEIFNDHLYFIVEDHSRASQNYPDNYIGLLNIKYPSEIKKIVEGSSFYSNPKISKDGKKLLWLQWDLPYMPWEASELFAGDIESDGSILLKDKIDGGIGSSIFQPEWKNDRSILYIKEFGDKGQLFHYHRDKVCLAIETPIDLLRPLWILGLTSYKVIRDDLVLACGWEKGFMKFILVDILNKNFTEFDFGVITDDLCITDKYILMAGSLDKFSNQIFYVEKKYLKANIQKPLEIAHKRVKITAVNKSYITHFLPTKNIFNSPPLIIKVHSGPTAHSHKGFSPEREYWTEKGFGVVEIDYRGSTSYGIKFRRSLDGEWGIYDTEDVLDVIKYIIKENIYDQDKLILKGSSAGGFTLLNVLSESSMINCACCYYAVSDLQDLLSHTHKFESGYTKTLLGEDNIWKSEDTLFESRSPICKIDNIKTPIIFFQGLNDNVVPPHQTEKLFKSLTNNGINAEIYLFQNEGHGFRGKKTIEQCLRLEEKFYMKNLDLERMKL